MLKDKPASYESPLPPWRQRKALILAAIVFLFYIIVASSSGHKLSKSARSPYPVNVDWGRYAYSQYATDQHYLCNSIMIFDQLERLGSKADRLLFYPKSWSLTVHSNKDRTPQLLNLARDKYHAKLRPVEMYTLKRTTHTDDETWDASINKLHAWNQGEYHRIIHLDSDSTLLQSIDELFFLPLSPGSPIAMPRAYWKLDEPIENGGGVHKLTSMLVVLEPLASEASVLWDLAAGIDPSSPNTTSVSTSNLLDMELLNSRYFSTALMLPHRPYALITGEFRRRGVHNHTHYLGNSFESWNPHTALAEAKVVHFSDWPLPKPHIMWPNGQLVEMQPACEEGTKESEKGCEDRAVWKGLYDDFRKRRKEVCRLLSVPAPMWPPRPARTGKKAGTEANGDGSGKKLIEKTGVEHEDEEA